MITETSVVVAEVEVGAPQAWTEWEGKMLRGEGSSIIGLVPQDSHTFNSAHESVKQTHTHNPPSSPCVQTHTQLKGEADGREGQHQH